MRSIGLSLCLLLAQGVHAQDLPEGFHIESIRWAGTVEPNTLISVNNPYGSVYLRLSDDGRAELSSQIQALTEKPFEIGVRRDDDNNLLIEVTKLIGRPDVFVRDENGNFEGRVDLSVFVPSGINLLVRMTQGDLQARGLENDIVASTASGNLQIRTSGSVQASSLSGNIDVTLQGKSWIRPVALQTSAGNIRVELTHGAQAQVLASTSGTISTRFSDVLAQETTGSDKFVALTVGGGASLLAATSQSGNIVIQTNP